jgi:hypothetical protein
MQRVFLFLTNPGNFIAASNQSYTVLSTFVTEVPPQATD